MLMALLLIGCQTVPAPPPVVQEPILVVTVRPTNAPTDAPADTPVPTPSPSPVPTDTPAPSEAELLRAYIAGMTLEEKLGQLCMFGFSGTETVSDTFADLMRQYHIGNVILYGQNIVRTNGDGGFAQCRALTDSVRAASDSEIPLLISIDLEGGTVKRFEWARALDSARTLGQKNDAERAEALFTRIGDGLVSAGITVDLAPVLDMAPDPDSHFLGSRIISADPDITARIGAACVRGLHAANVLSIVKHFPGHGAVNTDSHEKTPVSHKTADALWAYDLIPFRAVLDSGADGVMVGHLLFDAIDDEHIASQSFVFITEFLRWELGFEGIVMSDDFRMAGLRSQTSLGEGAVQFLLAGGDLILCGAKHDYQRQILSGLYDAVKSGTLSEARIDESVFRILSAKLRVTDWSVS